MLWDSRCCIPVWWFTRNDVLYAKCWEMQTAITDNGSRWRVIIREDYEVAELSFMKNFIDFEAEAGCHGLPRPSQILGVLRYYQNNETF